MILGIDHTAISVPDLRSAVDFYCNVLGFEVESEEGWPVGAKRVDSLVGLPDSSSQVVMIRLADTRIEILEYTSPEPTLQDRSFRVCDHGITHFCLSVTQIEEEYERLCEAGVEFNHPPVDVGSSICIYGRDPFGNVFEMKEHKAPAEG